MAQTGGSYWGQDGAGTQKRLSFYCEDDTIDTIPLAFLYVFRGKGGDPVVDLGSVRVTLPYSFVILIPHARLVPTGMTLSSAARTWPSARRWPVISGLARRRARSSL